MVNFKKILGADFRRKMRYVLSFMPDKLFLQIHYILTVGKFINFKNPKGFNEKLQWLKVNDKRPEYTNLVDKLAVREHIKEVLGEEYLFPLLGHWESFDDIDFSKLPEKFVLKCNHDSGSTKVITKKSALNEETFSKLNEHFTNRLKREYFYAGREYPYKGIKPYIIAEQFMIDEKNPERSIDDYKFYCFGGEPKMMLMVTDRSTDCRFDFFDMDFNHLDVKRSHPNSDKPIEKPKMFEEMREIAVKLAKDKKFVRIDLYELNGQIYFGEYTFFAGGGFQLFEPPEWERKLGDWIKLS